MLCVWSTQRAQGRLRFNNIFSSLVFNGKMKYISKHIFDLIRLIFNLEKYVSIYKIAGNYITVSEIIRIPFIINKQSSLGTSLSLFKSRVEGLFANVQQTDNHRLLFYEPNGIVHK